MIALLDVIYIVVVNGAEVRRAARDIYFIRIMPRFLPLIASLYWLAMPFEENTLTPGRSKRAGMRVSLRPHSLHWLTSLSLSLLFPNCSRYTDDFITDELFKPEALFITLTRRWAEDFSIGLILQWWHRCRWITSVGYRHRAWLCERLRSCSSTRYHRLMARYITGSASLCSSTMLFITFHLIVCPVDIICKLMRDF